MVTMIKMRVSHFTRNLYPLNDIVISFKVKHHMCEQHEWETFIIESMILTSGTAFMASLEAVNVMNFSTSGFSSIATG
jgi:hypothetical protein